MDFAPPLFVKDGNLISLIRRMIHARGPDTVRSLKSRVVLRIKEVQRGQARAENHFRNDQVHDDANLGGRDQTALDMDTVVDVLLWPYSVSILCEFTSFPGTLHQPEGSGGT